MKKKLLEDAEIISNIEELSIKYLESLKDGGKVILAGNGGSFGDLLSGPSPYKFKSK